MKRKLLMMMLFLIMFILSILMGAAENREEGDCIGFGGADLKIMSVTTVEEVKTPAGVMAAEHRNNRLLEVKMDCMFPEPGDVIIMPSAFSATYRFRGTLKAVPARGFGMKLAIASGEVYNFILTEPSANVVLETTEPGDWVEFYLYFELPKEVIQFHVQAPSVVVDTAVVM